MLLEVGKKEGAVVIFHYKSFSIILPFWYFVYDSAKN